MLEAQRFAFTEIEKSLGAASGLPYLPLTLHYQGVALSVSGLLDTGATVNVLPYNIGNQLGLIWGQQTTSVHLTGNLANFQARALVLSSKIGDFAPVRLAFAWTRNDEVPLILGQVNFFLEFDACFFRSRKIFEVKPKDL
ncbi:MAG: retroviral-like aspartic protease [Anaerolineales bacterium]